MKGGIYIASAAAEAVVCPWDGASSDSHSPLRFLTSTHVKSTRGRGPRRVGRGMMPSEDRVTQPYDGSA